MSNPESADAGPSVAQEKRKMRYAKWSRIAGLLVAVVAVVRLVSLFMPHEIPHCDDSEIQATAQDILKEAMASKGIKAQLKGLSNVTEGPRTASLARCTAVANLAEGDMLLSYNVERTNGKDVVRLTGLKPI